MSGEKMEIELVDLESGAFNAGLRFYSEKSNNWHVRLAMAKLIRAVEKQSEEPFKEYQDFLREFGEKDKGGNVTVSPPSLTKEKAESWDKVIKEWRARTISVECDLLDNGKLPIKLPKEVLDTFPHRFMEALMNYVTFEEITESKEDETARLRKERDEAFKKLEGKA